MLTTTTACSIASQQRLAGIEAMGGNCVIVEVAMGCRISCGGQIAIDDFMRQHDAIHRGMTVRLHGLSEHRNVWDRLSAIRYQGLIVLDLPEALQVHPEEARNTNDEEACRLVGERCSEVGFQCAHFTLLAVRSTDWHWRETRAEVARIRCLLGTARQNALDEVAAALVAGHQGAADILALFGRSTLTDQ